MATAAKPIRALTIAGSDSGGGAGIQADLKTFMALGAYGMSAVTAVTVQNTLGVSGVLAIPAETVAAQIAAVVEDIGVDVVKVGMLFSAPIIRAVAAAIDRFRLAPVVWDPVMRAKGGHPLLDAGAEEDLLAALEGRATVVTPNLPEASRLVGFTVDRPEAMEAAGRVLVRERGIPYALIKGGHLDSGEAADVLVWRDGLRWLRAPRIATVHTHGTGCSLSSAIAVYLGQGMDPPEAVAAAKTFVTEAIAHAPGLGRGHGPLAHDWAWRRR